LFFITFLVILVILLTDPDQILHKENPGILLTLAFNIFVIPFFLKQNEIFFMKRNAYSGSSLSKWTWVTVFLSAFVLLNLTATAADIEGRVLGSGSAIAGSTVTLYAAGTGNPKKLAQGKSDDKGYFKFHVDKLFSDINDAVLYLVANGGTPKVSSAKGANNATSFLLVLGTTLPKKVTINEFTTIASVWTSAQFLKGEVLQGIKLGLEIAAGNVPNFVDLETGSYGATLANDLNSSQSPTLANFTTLANLLAACVARVQDDAASRLFALATPPGGIAPANTLSAAENIARNSALNADKIFSLFEDLYPVPKGKNLRPTPFTPYLSFAPSAWVLALRFSGGGLSAPGKIMFDSKGNLWAGDNFIVGAQNKDALWDGNITKFAPNGKPLSPMITGFTGGGVQGIGFGLAIDAHDNAWATCYGSKAIVKFSSKGEPLSPPDGYNFNHQLGLMQGIIVTPNGDVWAADVEKSQIVYMPKGDPAKAKLLFQNHTGNPRENPGKLVAPFHLAIDQQDRIWVSNAAADWVTRFAASDPTKVETFKVGFSPSGMAVDSKGNLWVTNRLGNSMHGKEILGRMLEIGMKGGNMDPTLTMALAAQESGPNGGSVTVLRPDGSEAPFSPVVGGGLYGPWAAVVDGDDNVWISNFAGPHAGIVEICGANAEKWPAGKKMGDFLSPPGGYVGGGLQFQIDLAIDPAGNVWVCNNWEDIKAVLDPVAEPFSTLGAGQGMVVFYGLAKPVKTPLIGPVQVK
jgi:hypothetical protein